MKADPPGQKQKCKKSAKKTVNVKWIVTIFLTTMVISAIFSSVSTELLEGSTLIPAFCILMVIILIGILFDIIGVSVTAADPKPFHSMAAHKAVGAQEALTMLRNAEKVSSFCNDVVGDICGVISGTASASIVVLVLAQARLTGAGPQLLEIAMASLVSGLTVGGKAVGKTFAMTRSTDIVYMAARAVYYFKFTPKLIGKLFSRNSKK